MAKRKSRSTRRLFYAIGGLIVLLVILGLGASQFGLFGGEEGIPVDVATAEERDVTQVVTASGKLQPEVDVTISPEVSGEVIYLGVEEGDYVEEGTRLVGIEREFYEAQVQQAEAGVAQAKANEQLAYAQLLQAENMFNRKQKLYDRNVIPEQEYQDARTQYRVAQARYEAAQYQVQSAEARLREAQEQLESTNIYAPMSGTISQLNIEVGERVVGTEQRAGTEMMTVAKLNRMEVEVDVNENDVVNVALGDTAHIEVDAYPTRTFTGVITEIANSARTENAGTQEQVTIFPVKVRILSTNVNVLAGGQEGRGVQASELPVGEEQQAAQLRPGMSATVDIFTETAFDAIAVPIQAVTVRDFNEVRQDSAAGGPQMGNSSSFGPTDEDLRRVVFVLDDGAARMQEVTTGISDATHIEIESGLSGGETVIIGPYRAVSRELAPGDKVRVRNNRPGRPQTL